MSRYFILFLFYFTFHFISAQVSLQEIRKAFYEVKTEPELNNFIIKAKKCTQPEAKAYLASSLMWKADFAFFPTKKLSFFNKGKKMIETLVKDNPNMLEAHYIRALLKSQAPKFLGYSKGYNLDLDYVKNNLSKSDIPNTYKTRIQETLKKYNLL